MGPVSHEGTSYGGGQGRKVSQLPLWWAAPTDRLWMLGRDSPTALPSTLQNRRTILSLPAGLFENSVT